MRMNLKTRQTRKGDCFVFGLASFREHPCQHFFFFKSALWFSDVQCVYGEALDEKTLVNAYLQWR